VGVYIIIILIFVFTDIVFVVYITLCFCVCICTGIDVVSLIILELGLLEIVVVYFHFVLGHVDVRVLQEFVEDGTLDDFDLQFEVDLVHD